MPTPTATMIAKTLSSMVAGKATHELVDDGGARLDGRPEVAAEKPTEPCEVLLDGRPVEAVQLVDLGDPLRCGAFAEERHGGAARKGADPQEQQDRQPEQGRDEQEEPLADGA